MNAALENGKAAQHLTITDVIPRMSYTCTHGTASGALYDLELHERMRVRGLCIVSSWGSGLGRSSDRQRSDPDRAILEGKAHPGIGQKTYPGYVFSAMMPPRGDGGHALPSAGGGLTLLHHPGRHLRP